MTTLFWGGTAILLEVFDATRSLGAVERHKVNILGQIPAMFNYQWRLADFDRFDLSSLAIAVYGGPAGVETLFERLSRMAPRVATGLDLTESAGFCTYTPIDGGVDDILAGLGRDMPLYRMSIRAPMRPDGLAGEELPAGEVGEICFKGPQTFLGYVNDPEATAETVSRDGFLYTGDMGSIPRHGPALLGPLQVDHQARRAPGLSGRRGEPPLGARGESRLLRCRGRRAPAAERSHRGVRGEEARSRTHRGGTSPARQGA